MLLSGEVTLKINVRFVGNGSNFIVTGKCISDSEYKHVCVPVLMFFTLSLVPM